MTLVVAQNLNIYQRSRENLGQKAGYHNVVGTTGFGLQMFEMYFPNFMFEFPCIGSLYFIRNQQDATLSLSFISHCKITLHVSDAFCVHHQEY